MTKIIDVDYIDNFKLVLTFNDSFEGVADLEVFFLKEPFKTFADSFLQFALHENGSLVWSNENSQAVLSSNELREITQGTFTNKQYIDPNKPLDVITAAFRESLEEDDPTILQAALRGYANKIGMSDLIKETDIKSRTSAYKSLSSEGSPKWDTLFKIAQGIIKLASNDENIPLSKLKEVQ